MRAFLIRALVAVVAIPLVLLVFHAGGRWLDLFVGVLILLGGIEVHRMIAAMGVRFPRPVPVVFGIACAVVVWPIGGDIWVLWLLALTVASVLAAFRGSSGREMAPAISAQMAASIWLGIGFGALVALRALDPADGYRWLVFLFVNLWVGDTAAYLFGVWLGKRPLAPMISPKKTVAGEVAQVITAGAIALVFIRLDWLPSSAGLILIAALLIAAVGQLGDLFESTLKRAAGVKDSSSILPGHGGVLDRFDSAMFAAPALWILVKLWG